MVLFPVQTELRSWYNRLCDRGGNVLWTEFSIRRESPGMDGPCPAVPMLWYIFRRIGQRHGRNLR